MPSRKLLLLSNSKQHSQGYLEWCTDHVKSFFEKSGVTKILFIPYAIRDYDGYVQKVRPAFEKLGLNIESIHEKPDPVTAINDCQGIFVERLARMSWVSRRKMELVTSRVKDRMKIFLGGGNTFLLLKTLYDNHLIENIQKCVLVKSVPYMGASAGTNVATKSINTTNDMPICYPPSFDALQLVPFNINPHYVDPDPNSKHMGETREERIKEYHEQSICTAVLGLKEGSGLLIENTKATLIGLSSAKLFQKGREPISYEAGSDLSFLLNETCY